MLPALLRTAQIHRYLRRQRAPASYTDQDTYGIQRLPEELLVLHHSGHRRRHVGVLVFYPDQAGPTLVGQDEAQITPFEKM